MDGKLQWRLRRGDTSHQAQYGDIQPQYGHFGLSVTSEPKREPGNHHQMVLGNFGLFYDFYYLYYLFFLTILISCKGFISR